MKHINPAIAHLSLDTMVVQNKQIFASELDDDVVMANFDREKYYGLNGVGARIWQLIQTPTAVALICGHLMEEFDVDATTCQREVVAFVREMLNAEIATIHTA